MGIARKYVFPILRLGIWAVIAAALSVIAFGSHAAPPSQADPEANARIDASTVAVTRGSVQNSVVIDGTIQADPATKVKATSDGEVTVLQATSGKPIAMGATILEVKKPKESPTAPSTDADGDSADQATTPAVTYSYSSIKATAAGVLTISVLPGQSVAIGDVIATITPQTLSASGSLTPEQRYRLLTMPKQAEVAITDGPAPFTCPDLTVANLTPDTDTKTPTDDQAVDPNTGEAIATAGTISCTIPAGVTAFPGLKVAITIVSGQSDDVLLVPVTAVQGTAQTGNVWVVGDDGSQEKRAVKLGLSDGEMVEVSEGLTEGEQVLEFIPAGEQGADKDPQNPNDMQFDENGNPISSGDLEG